MAYGRTDLSSSGTSNQASRCGKILRCDEDVRAIHEALISTSIMLPLTPIQCPREICFRLRPISYVGGLFSKWIQSVADVIGQKLDCNCPVDGHKNSQAG
jgi:hypothetical protein